MAERIVLRRRDVRLELSLAIWLLYGAACALPAVGPTPGILALLWGWIPPFIIPWSANWLMFLGWAMLIARQNGTAAVLGGLASVLALTSWLWVVSSPDFVLGPGYYCWQGSMLVLWLGAMVTSASQSHRRR